MNEALGRPGVYRDDMECFGPDGAEAQQTGVTGTVNDYWAVNLGYNSNTTQDTTGKTIASQSFSGWMNQTFDFIATTSSELLSFTSMSPGGSPPFALLTNVSASARHQGLAVTICRCIS